jgi:hypothetical protein
VVEGGTQGEGRERTGLAKVVHGNFDGVLEMLFELIPEVLGRKSAFRFSEKCYFNPMTDIRVLNDLKN